MLGCFKGINQYGRNTAPPSAEKLLKVFLSMVLLIRETRPSFTHQWAETRPSHQELCANLLESLIYWRVDSRSKKNYNTSAGGIETINAEN